MIETSLPEELGRLTLPHGDSSAARSLVLCESRFDSGSLASVLPAARVGLREPSGSDGRTISPASVVRVRVPAIPGPYRGGCMVSSQAGWLPAGPMSLLAVVYGHVPLVELRAEFESLKPASAYTHSESTGRWARSGSVCLTGELRESRSRELAKRSAANRHRSKCRPEMTQGGGLRPRPPQALIGLLAEIRKDLSGGKRGATREPGDAMLCTGKLQSWRGGDQPTVSRLPNPYASNSVPGRGHPRLSQGRHRLLTAGGPGGGKTGPRV